MKQAVRTLHPENRLAKAIDVPGGLTIDDALDAAHAGLESVREECMAALDAKIARIDAATATRAFTTQEGEIDKVYALANEILNEAGVFGLTELSEAGRSLCELLAKRVHGLDLEPVRVHVVAMKSLRRSDVHGDAAIRTAVLDGLRQVTAKLTRSEESAA